MPLWLRETAFFSAAVESARTLAIMQEKILTSTRLQREELANGKTAFVDRSSFIGDLRKHLADAGYQAERGKEGGLEDLSSRKRLGLIFDIQMGSAQGFSAWKIGQDPDLLDAFPAQELVRLEGRQQPRDWQRRWVDAGGQLIGGRMVALKTDAIWKKISRFGRPWPPFDFESGMGLDETDRDEAEALGLLGPEDEPEPSEAAFTDELQASARGLSPKFRDALGALFGDQVEFAGDTVRWRGGNTTAGNSRVYRRDRLA